MDLYVADRFIGWQETALQVMSLHLTDSSDVASFGKLTGPLLDEVRRKDVSGGMSEAELKRTIIPFAKFHWTEALEGGKQARTQPCLLRMGLPVVCLLTAHLTI